MAPVEQQHDQDTWSRHALVLLDHVAEALVLLDAAGTIVHANRRTEELLQLSLQEWRGRSALDVLHPEDHPLGAELLASSQATGPGVKEPVTYRFRVGDGTSWRALEIVASALELDGVPHLLVSGREPQRREGDAIVAEAGVRLSRMFDEAAIGMAQLSLEGRFLRTNRRLLEDLGAEEDWALRTSVGALVPAEDWQRFAGAWKRLLDGDETHLSLELPLVAPSGRLAVSFTATIVHDHHGEPMYVAAQLLDVTERVEVEEQLRRSERRLRATELELLHQSTHDPLTGLGNRLLIPRLEQDLDAAGTSRAAVAYLDLDGFKDVNDRLGHAAGDALLSEVGRRLRTSVRPDDEVLRLGGDEFLLVARDLTAEDATALVHRVQEAVVQPVDLDGEVVQVGASAGLATGPATTGLQVLIEVADRALYDAKRRRAPNGPTLVHVAASADGSPADGAPGSRWSV